MMKSRNINKLFSISKRGFQSTSRAFIKVGDQLPSKEAHLDSPATSINLLEHFKKHDLAILFGVPGAFTPGCSKSHLPGYLEKYQEFKNKGVKEIACISVNDAFVMSSWGKANDADNKVTMLADFKADITKALDLNFDIPVLGGTRSKRFAMILKNGKVDQLFIEPDNTGLSVSLAENVLKKL